MNGVEYGRRSMSSDQPFSTNPTDVRLHRTPAPVAWSVALLGGIFGLLALGFVGALVGAVLAGLAAHFGPRVLGGQGAPTTRACSSCGDQTLAESGVCPDCAAV